jgi:hypothetical protein
MQERSPRVEVFQRSKTQEFSMKSTLVFCLVAVLSAGAALPALAQSTTTSTPAAGCPTTPSATGNQATGIGPGSAKSGGTESVPAGNENAGAQGANTANCPSAVVPGGAPNTGGNNNPGTPGASSSSGGSTSK